MSSPKFGVSLTMKIHLKTPFKIYNHFLTLTLTWHIPMNNLFLIQNLRKKQHKSQRVLLAPLEGMISLLVTLHISSLYTDIPNHEGMQACAKALSESIRQSSPPSLVFLMQLLRMVLQMNNFEFNGQHCLQVDSAAMGIRLAPSYANLFMAILRKNLSIPTKTNLLIGKDLLRTVFFFGPLEGIN